MKNNGSNIFNYDAYNSNINNGGMNSNNASKRSQRMIKEERFEQNFQKPMAYINILKF